MSDTITYPIIDYRFSYVFPLSPEELQWEIGYDIMEFEMLLNDYYRKEGVFKLENY